MKKIIQIISIVYFVITSLVISGVMKSTSQIFFTYFHKKNLLIPSLTNLFIENMGLISMVPIIMGLLSAIIVIISQKFFKDEAHKHISIIIIFMLNFAIIFATFASYLLAMAMPFININKSI